MTTSITVGLKGLYKLGKKDKDGNIITETDWIPNLITNYGLNSGFTSSFQYGWCGVGSGNTVPSFSDVQLVSPLGSRIQTVTAQANGNSGSPNYYYYRRRTFEFPLGSIVGNVAEVMLAASSSGATAFTRSLVKDSGGNPITFPVLVGEQLYVTYELREYFNTADATGTMVLKSISYPYLIRSCNIAGTESLFSGGGQTPAPEVPSAVMLVSSETQQPNTSQPSDSGAVYPTSFSMAAYTNDTFYRDITYNWSPAVANFGGGIGAILVRAQTSNSQLKFAIYLTGAKIPKTNVDTFSITLRWQLTRI